MDTILFTLETDIYHGKNTPMCVPPLTKKTMLMHKIAMPQPAVELAKLHRAILLRDAAPVRSRRADCRNIAYSCGNLSENRCHPTLSENSSTQDSARTCDVSAICRQDRTGAALRHATESHGGVLPIQQLVVALRFMHRHRFFCKWRHALSCVFTVININDSL